MKVFSKPDPIYWLEKRIADAQELQNNNKIQGASNILVVDINKMLDGIPKKLNSSQRIKLIPALIRLLEVCQKEWILLEQQRLNPQQHFIHRVFAFTDQNDMWPMIGKALTLIAEYLSQSWFLTTPDSVHQLYTQLIKIIKSGVCPFESKKISIEILTSIPFRFFYDQQQKEITQIIQGGLEKSLHEKSSELSFYAENLLILIINKEGKLTLESIRKYFHHVFIESLKKRVFLFHKEDFLELIEGIISHLPHPLELFKFWLYFINFTIHSDHRVQQSAAHLLSEYEDFGFQTNTLTAGQINCIIQHIQHALKIKTSGDEEDIRNYHHYLLESQLLLAFSRNVKNDPEIIKTVVQHFIAGFRKNKNTNLLDLYIKPFLNNGYISYLRKTSKYVKPSILQEVFSRLKKYDALSRYSASVISHCFFPNTPPQIDDIPQEPLNYDPPQIRHGTVEHDAVAKNSILRKFNKKNRNSHIDITSITSWLNKKINRQNPEFAYDALRAIFPDCEKFTHRDIACLITIYNNCHHDTVRRFAAIEISYFLIFQKDITKIPDNLINILSNIKGHRDYLEYIEEIIDIFLLRVLCGNQDRKTTILNAIHRILLNNDLPVVLYILNSLAFCCDYGFLKREELTHFKTSAIVALLQDESHNKNAIAYVIQEALENAINKYHHLINKNTTSDSIRRSAYCLDLAYCYARVAKPKSARRAYKKAIYLNSNSARAYYEKALFFADHLKNTREAINCFHLSRKIKDNYAPTYFHLARLHDNEGQLGLAINNIEIALSARHNYLLAMELSVKLHYKVHDLENAREAYNNVVNKFPYYYGMSRKVTEELNANIPATHVDSVHQAEFDAISSILLTADDEALDDAFFVEILARLEKVTPEDTLKATLLWYDSPLIRTSEYPNEKRRFLRDLLRAILEKTASHETQAAYALTQKTKARNANLLEQIHESKFSQVYSHVHKVSITDEELLKKLQEKCSVMTISDFIETYAGTNKLDRGYALGISDDMAATYTVFPFLFKLYRWEAAYGKHKIWDTEKHTAKFFDAIISDNKPIVFFVPTNIGDDENRGGVTYDEVKWLMRHIHAAEKLKNIILVFDAYNYLPFHILNRKLGNEVLQAEPSLQEVKKFLMEYVLPAKKVIPFHYETSPDQLHDFITEHTQLAIFGELIRFIQFNSKSDTNESKDIKLRNLKIFYSVITRYFRKQLDPEQPYLNFLSLFTELLTTREQITIYLSQVKFILYILQDPDYKSLFMTNEDKLNPMLELVFLKINEVIQVSLERIIKELGAIEIQDLINTLLDMYDQKDTLGTSMLSILWVNLFLLFPYSDGDDDETNDKIINSLYVIKNKAPQFHEHFQVRKEHVEKSLTKIAIYGANFSDEFKDIINLFDSEINLPQTVNHKSLLLYKTTVFSTQAMNPSFRRYSTGNFPEPPDSKEGLKLRRHTIA